jgi:hypothetical protein
VSDVERTIKFGTAITIAAMMFSVGGGAGTIIGTVGVSELSVRVAKAERQQDINSTRIEYIRDELKKLNTKLDRIEASIARLPG